MAAVVAEAQEQGHIRLFLDAGDQVLDVARVLYRSDPTPFLRTLVEHPGAVAPARGPVKDLVEQLTDREQMVLSYLPSRLSNAEIAAELRVSLNTLKSHLKHIYRKLGVAGRNDAITKAERSVCCSEEARLVNGGQTLSRPWPEIDTATVLPPRCWHGREPADHAGLKRDVWERHEHADHGDAARFDAHGAAGAPARGGAGERDRTARRWRAREADPRRGTTRVRQDGAAVAVGGRARRLSTGVGLAGCVATTTGPDSPPIWWTR